MFSRTIVGVGVVSLFPLVSSIKCLDILEWSCPTYAAFTSRKIIFSNVGNERGGERTCVDWLAFDCSPSPVS